MSPTGASKFTAPTLSHTTERPAQRPGGDHTSIQDGAASEGVRTKEPQTPRRAITAARVSPSRLPYPHSHDDPCNYLG
jgi:hypothetical protein